MFKVPPKLENDLRSRNDSNVLVGTQALFDAFAEPAAEAAEADGGLLLFEENDSMIDTL